MTIRGKHNSGSIINVFINMLQCVTIIIFFPFSHPPSKCSSSCIFNIPAWKYTEQVNIGFKSKMSGKMKYPKIKRTAPNNHWQILHKCSLHSEFLHSNSLEEALASVLSRNPASMLEPTARSTLPNVGQWAYVNFHCAGTCSWEAEERCIRKAFNA